MGRSQRGLPLTLEGHVDTVTSVSVTPDGAMIVSGSYDHTMRVWDARAGVCRAMLPVSVKTLSITHDGSTVVMGDWNNTVCVWDPMSKVLLATWQAPSIIERVEVTSGEPIYLYWID